MNIQERLIKLFFGGVVAWILFIVTTLAWHLWLFPEMNADLSNHTIKGADEWNYSSMIVFQLGLAFVFTFIYQYYKKDTPATLSGAMFGMLMGAVIGAPLAIYMPQFTFGDTAWPYAQLVFTLFQSSFVGIAVAHTQGIKIKHINQD